MSLLLENAVNSIRAGVSAFQLHDHEQLLSAVRSIHSGVLLLYKEALRRLSPEGTEEILVKTKIIPQLNENGKLFFVGKGKKTATVHEIRERFDALGIKTDWKRYRRIADVRNDVEHYFTSAHEDAIRGLIADAFVLVRDFLSIELSEDPLEILGSDTWELMLAESEVMERERASCQDALRGTAWSSPLLAKAVLELRCAECGSPLLMPRPSHDDDDLACRSCGHYESREDFAERAVKQHSAYDSYISLKEGGDSLYITCPFCQRDSYVLEENRCAGCAEECTQHCLRCENQIPPQELSDGDLCSWCDHMTSKD